MNKRRIAEKLDQVIPNRGSLTGSMVKLKNRRVTLATDGDNYFVYFKNLTSDGKIGKLSLALSKEAMFALAMLYHELDGPLPEGVKKL